MEPLIGVFVAFSVSIGLRFYFRFFASDGPRVKPFEAWCRERHPVLALRCPEDSIVDVYNVVRHQIEPHAGFLNTMGRYPWQHYVVSIDCRRPSDNVIALFVTDCRPLKIRERELKQVPELTRALAEIGVHAGKRVEEIWLHGQFHAVNRTLSAERESASWQGTFGENGAPNVEGMIGRPPWLDAALPQA